MTTPGPFSDKCEREGKGVNSLALFEGKGQKTRARGGQAVIFMILAMSNSSIYWNEALSKVW